MEADQMSEQRISARILVAMATGLDLVQAFDLVLGEGAYRRFADGLYDRLRAGPGGGVAV